jgi:hypothetical protein
MIFFNRKKPTQPPEQDQIMQQMSSSDPFKALQRCGCNCGQVINAATPLEEVEKKVFIVGHVPDEWREYARIQQQQRDAIAMVAQREARAAANLKSYTEIRERFERITTNKALLISCGVVVVDLLTTTSNELSRAEKLLGNDQRKALGLPEWHEPATMVIDPPKPLLRHRPEYVTG